MKNLCTVFSEYYSIFSNTCFSVDTVYVYLEIIIIEVIKTLILSVFLWLLIIGLLLLLTLITKDDAKRYNTGLFFMALIVVCIGTYTDIYNIEPLHCASGSMDLNLVDKSKEIVNEVSSSTPQAVVTEDLPNTIRSATEHKSTKLYDLPKKDWPMWAKGATDGVCGCAVPNTGPEHCTCNHDLVRTLCWSHMETMRCCKHCLPFPDYECAKCYCVFHQECLPQGHTVLKDSSEEWWRTFLRRGYQQDKVEISRQKLAFEKHGITYDDYLMQKSYHYENFRYGATAASNETIFRTVLTTKPRLKAMNLKIFKAILKAGKNGRKIPIS